MSDQSVRAALRSDAQLVVIDAPAGCGKTHQGADYGRELVASNPFIRPLILTHTHAASSVFAGRIKGEHGRVQVRTIDSLVDQIARIYHTGIGLPPDVAAWVRERKETGYQELAEKVAGLLSSRTMIAASLARRHPVVICDEHQDSSGAQHAIVMALAGQGALLRVFGDPMQKIYKDDNGFNSYPPCDWDSLGRNAQAFEELDYPHRWDSGCRELGKWTLLARKILKSNGRIDLREKLPSSVTLVYAENKAQSYLDYRLEKSERQPIDKFVESQESLLILARQNATTRALRSFFGRRIPLWEGHTRPGLERLVERVKADHGNRAALAEAVVEFMEAVGKGFSRSAFGNDLVAEARGGCSKTRRGRPALIQELARCLVDDPSHRGVARLFQRLLTFRANSEAFAEVELDCFREFREAIQLGEFETTDVGLTEIAHRRTYSRPKPPARAISTIHKAKGLECESVLVMPCNKSTFPEKRDARCLLYVALSRAKRRLMLVLSRDDPSPLFIL